MSAAQSIYCSYYSVYMGRDLIFRKIFMTLISAVRFISNNKNV